MYILREAVPGQKAKITVVRDGKQVTVTAEYGKPTRRN
jgi:S1-C subfamily serine protease